mgnify:FL=1
MDGKALQVRKRKDRGYIMVLLHGGKMICMIALAEGVDETRAAKVLQSIGEDFASEKLKASELYTARNARMYSGS